MPIQLLQALTQHANYLKMVRKCLDKGEAHCTCTDHHSCKFGQWFYGEANNIYRNHENHIVVKLWKEIEEHHIEFHQHSLKALDHLRNSVDTESEAVKAMKNCETEMMKRSTFLVNRLLELDQKLA